LNSNASNSCSYFNHRDHISHRASSCPSNFTICFSVTIHPLLLCKLEQGTLFWVFMQKKSSWANMCGSIIQQLWEFSFDWLTSSLLPFDLWFLTSFSLLSWLTAILTRWMPANDWNYLELFFPYSLACTIMKAVFISFNDEYILLCGGNEFMKMNWIFKFHFMRKFRLSSSTHRFLVSDPRNLCKNLFYVSIFFCVSYS